MSRLISRTPSAILEELRDEQTFPVVFYTGDGTNGVRQLRLADQARRGIDIGAMSLKLVMKTSETAGDTELGAFPLACTVVNAGDGVLEADFSAINFADPVGRVLVILFDDSGGKRVVVAKSKSRIERAGV